MRILLIDIDSKIPNLALKKIEKYYLDKNYEVIWNDKECQNKVDKIYVSCIFDWNKEKCNEWNGAEIGGGGYDIYKTLPSEIECVKPRINLGFTTRGCIRNCPFCVVPKKEGKIRIEADIYDIWDGKSKEIELLDNNILALPDHFEKICNQLIKEKLKLRENGLDIRLLNKDNAKLLASIRHYEYHFAFDNLEDEVWVTRGIKLLKNVGIKRSSFYVLIGYNTSFKENLYRLEFLKANNQSAYVQRFQYASKDIKDIALARWANQQRVFFGMTWEQFLNHKDNKRYKLYFEQNKNV